MSSISESAFSHICDGIREERDSIVKHNPVGTENEILLWMLLSCLISFLSLTDLEAPCFSGTPDENTYRNAILFILNDRCEGDFDAATHIERMLSK